MSATTPAFRRLPRSLCRSPCSFQHHTFKIIASGLIVTKPTLHFCPPRLALSSVPPPLPVTAQGLFHANSVVHEHSCAAQPVGPPGCSSWLCLGTMVCTESHQFSWPLSPSVGVAYGCLYLMYPSCHWRRLPLPTTASQLRLAHHSARHIRASPPRFFSV